MCLSIVYKNTITPETLILRNVMRLECREGYVILTDLMERTMAIEGNLEMADLVDGFVIIREKSSANAIAEAVASVTAAGGKVDYIEILDCDTMTAPNSETRRVILAAAAFFGTTRLIDNEIFEL